MRRAQLGEGWQVHHSLGTAVAGEEIRSWRRIPAPVCRGHCRHVLGWVPLHSLPRHDQMRLRDWSRDSLTTLPKLPHLSAVPPLRVLPMEPGRQSFIPPSLDPLTDLHADDPTSIGASLGREDSKPMPSILHASIPPLTNADKEGDSPPPSSPIGLPQHQLPRQRALWDHHFTTHHHHPSIC